MLKKTSFAYQTGSFEGGAAINREKISETLYVDGLYEINKENGNTARKHLIKAGSNSVAVYTETTGTTPAINLRYLYYDHLGSLDNITDENGTIIHTANFDAWGRERHPQNMNYYNIPTTDITDLGYTGHRQVGNFGLVHMRGRVYDPLLGWFLSPDPIIQYPLDLQTYNRYAYVRNNPLIYIDPSGYGFSFKKFFKKVIAPVLGMVLTGGGMHFIAAGFFSGGVGAAVNGGNILKGAVTGAFSAAAFNWAGHVNHGIRPIQAHFVAGAVSSGFSASVYGGSMGRAALTGGISGALGKSVTLNNRFKHVSPGNFHAGQFAATMAAGGIGSYISGGSFGDGAAVSGMGYVYNHLKSMPRVNSKDELAKYEDGAYLLTKRMDIFEGDFTGHSALATVRNGKVEILNFGPGGIFKGSYNPDVAWGKFEIDQITDFVSSGYPIRDWVNAYTPPYIGTYNCASDVAEFLSKHGRINYLGILPSLKTPAILKNNLLHGRNSLDDSYFKYNSGGITSNIRYK